MKYGIWNVSEPGMEQVNRLVSGGYGPLTAMILAARGMQDSKQANVYLDCSGALIDPFAMKDMDLAAGRLCLALSRGEKIAVFGDYDVDGITATCLLTDFIRSMGGDCVPYIPGRLEEGYGLNPIAIDYLHSLGVKLIVTVDCGITAMDEAQLCARLGMDLVITDHHECKDTLPQAVAVVDPHRPDCAYPHGELSGVGVAFKLASALCGSQQEVLEKYADMVCLGTVADVMLLRGENRVFVSRGLEALRNTRRPGLLALMEQSGCDREGLTASSVGYTLAPRINAAGRMGQIDLAVELFLTQDEEKGQELAKALCELNKQRQSVESEIFQQAVDMLPQGNPDAIVLAEESWHQGVVGIVASRIAEEYCCPTFLICLDKEHGKASSRSYGGFNLFSSLSSLSNLLESYGGHEQAAGFTIKRGNIPAFREEISALARKYYTDDTIRTVLETDCAIPPEMLTVSNIAALSQLEPCGNGCPKPVLVMQGLRVDRICPVGNGRHLRLRLQSSRQSFQAIWFCTDLETASIEVGDLVDVAFNPQINEFKNERTVQMNVLDIRPSCKAECSMQTAAYQALCAGSITPEAARELMPDRVTLGAVWRYLAQTPTGVIRENPACLCRKIVRKTEAPLSLEKLMTCLDIFADVGLLKIQRYHKYITITLLPVAQKADLTQSLTMQKLAAVKES